MPSKWLDKEGSKLIENGKQKGKASAHMGILNNYQGPRASYKIVRLRDLENNKLRREKTFKRSRAGGCDLLLRNGIFENQQLNKG